MRCFFCHDDVPNVGKDVKAVLCGRCTSRLVAPPDLKPPVPKLSHEEKEARKVAKVEKKKAKLEKLKTAKRGFGRGWHLKKLFEYDGEYFSFGKKITSAEAAKIRKQLKKAGV